MDQKKRNEILVTVTGYVKKKIKERYYPPYKELKGLFNINYWRITLADIYPRLKVNISQLPFRKSKTLRVFRRKELIKYLKNEVRHKHYPTRREIERGFRIKLNTLFNNIEELYAVARIGYKQATNQEIKKIKAELLMSIILSLFSYLDLSLVKKRRTTERGVDILTKDKNGKLVGLELKAYNEFEMVKKKDILQIKRFIEEENLTKILLITTTSKIQKGINISKDITIFLYPELERIVKDKKLKKDLIFIRKQSTNVITVHKDAKRKKIIEYIKKRYKEGKDISYNNILKTLNLDLYTYFKDIYEAYDTAHIPIPIRRGLAIGRRAKYPNKRANNELRDKIIKYIKEEARKGHYPSGEDISEKFEISHIWNFFTMRELCNIAGIEPYFERKSRATSF